MMFDSERKESLLIRWKRWLADRSVLSGILCVCLSVAVPFFYQAMIEFVRMKSFSLTVEYIFIRWRQILLGGVVLTVLFAILILLTRRPAVPAGILGVVLLVAGCVNYFKLSYRGDPLVPHDFFVLTEAMDVAGGLELKFTREMWLFLLAVAAITTVCTLVRLPVPAHGKSVLWGRLGGVVVLIVAGLWYTTQVLWNKEKMSEFSVGVTVRSMADAYYRGTFVTSYLCLIGNAFVPAPEGYTEDVIQALAEQLAAMQTDEGASPDILVVMAESWYDLQAAVPAQYTEELMENYRAIAKEGVSGYLLSEGYGGGTANVEFSVLTGFNMNYLQSGSVPYVEYVYKELDSYPLYLKKGNATTAQAMHSYINSFYNRPNAYAAMGFDSYLSMEYLTDVTYRGPYISEMSLMENLIRTYEQVVEEDPSQVFIHTVTMQNHIQYEGGIYTDDFRVGAKWDGMTAGEQAVLETVATNMRDIDEALGFLVEYLRGCDREVILLFFGDHQTPVTDSLGNDVTDSYGIHLELTGGQAVVEQYKTPYLIWANYDTRESQTEELISADRLLPLLVGEYQLDAPAWFTWLYENMDVLRGYARGWVIGPDGQLLTEPTAEQQAVLDAAKLLQYDAMFGKGYAETAMYG